MILYRCTACGIEHDRWMVRCPGCRERGVMALSGGRSKAETAPVSRFQTLQDAPALKGYRIDTGIPGLNRVLGANRLGRGTSGLHVPSSVVFGGAQGCGKTTLLLTMLARMHESDILLLSTEQTLAEIKSNLVGIGLGRYASRIPAYSLLDSNGSLQKAQEIIHSLDPRCVVIDSINDLHDEHSKIRNRLDQRVNLIRHFKQDSEDNNRAIFMTAHLTKSDSVAGKREQLHVASTILMLRKEDEKRRVLYCPDKNRFGDISQRAYFEMGPGGLKEVPEEPEADARVSG